MFALRSQIRCSGPQILCRSVSALNLKSFSSAANPRPEVYDVVCIGGGPVGLSIVTALSKLAYPCYYVLF